MAWLARMRLSWGEAFAARMNSSRALVALAGWVNEQQLGVIEYFKEENRVLQEQLGGRRLRFTDDQRRRLAAKGKALGRRVLRELGTIVTPDTIFRWYRRLVTAKYDGSSKRRPGRPRVMDSIRALAARMARENERWGYTWIVGELGKLGHAISRSTVRRILKERGIDPAPERSKRMPWSMFLKAHWEAIAAADFFTVELLSRLGHMRYVVFFVMDLPTRKVEVAGVAPIPDGLWMEQVARNLIDDFSGFLRRKRFLIHDRDPLYTKRFCKLLRSGGVTAPWTDAAGSDGRLPCPAGICRRWQPAGPSWTATTQSRTWSFEVDRKLPS